MQSYLSSRHPEDFEPYYNASLADMTMHWNTEAFTLTSMKVFPGTLEQWGTKVNIRDYFHNHPVNPTTQWDMDEAIVIPSTVPYTNDSLCGDQPMTFLFGVYHGYGLFAPLKRNPT